MASRVGMLTIGQAPRPDLVAPFARLRPDVALVEAGALDGLDEAALPGASGGGYPLTTRLADGTPVTLDEAVLEPLVEAARHRLEAAGVVATLLLCAGPFAAVRGGRPFLRPFALAAAVLRSAGVGRVGVLVPTEDQRDPAARKYAAAGFDPVVWAAPVTAAAARLPGWLADEAASGDPVGHVVLDYVGGDPDLVADLRAAAGVPLVDLGLLAAAALAATV